MRRRLRNLKRHQSVFLWRRRLATIFFRASRMALSASRTLTLASLRLTSPRKALDSMLWALSMAIRTSGNSLSKGVFVSAFVGFLAIGVLSVTSGVVDLKPELL